MNHKGVLREPLKGEMWISPLPLSVLFLLCLLSRSLLSFLSFPLLVSGSVFVSTLHSVDISARRGLRAALHTRSFKGHILRLSSPEVQS